MPASFYDNYPSTLSQQIKRLRDETDPEPKQTQQMRTISQKLAKRFEYLKKIDEDDDPIAIYGFDKDDYEQENELEKLD